MVPSEAVSHKFNLNRFILLSQLFYHKGLASPGLVLDEGTLVQIYEYGHGTPLVGLRWDRTITTKEIKTQSINSLE